MDEKEPTRRTPTGHEIPVPKRGDVLRDLLKVARRPVSDDDNDSPDSCAARSDAQLPGLT